MLWGFQPVLDMESLYMDTNQDINLYQITDGACPEYCYSQIYIQQWNTDVLILDWFFSLAGWTKKN